MQIHEKDWLIFQVQLDHLSGEDIGGAIDEFYAAGAANVQVIPTITKKNRPGHIFQIDARPERQDAIETIIVRELRSSGWHVYETTHRYLNVEYLEKDARFAIGSEVFSVLVEAKKLFGLAVTIRPEDRSSTAIKEAAAKRGLSLSRAYCRDAVRKAFETDSCKVPIVLKEDADER